MQLSKHLQMQAMQFYLLIKLFGFEVDLILRSTIGKDENQVKEEVLMQIAH
jgi:hypothetical protein